MKIFFYISTAFYLLTSNCFSQDIQDYVKLLGIKKINAGDCEYRYPISSFAISINNDELLVLSRNFNLNKNTAILKGFTIDINTLESTPLTLTATDKKISKNLSLESINHTDTKLIVNLLNTQLIFNKQRNSFIFKELLDFRNLTGNVHIDDHFTILSRLGYFNPAEIHKQNSIYLINYSKLKERQIEADGLAFQNLKPAQFIDFNNDITVYVDPVHYLIYTTAHTKEKILINNRKPSDWETVSSMKLKMIDHFSDMGSLSSFLKDLQNEISRINKIYLTDKNHLFVVYQSPFESDYREYLDVFKLVNKDWKPLQRGLSLNAYFEDFDKEAVLTYENFPATFSLIGNLVIYTDNKVLIIREGHPESFEGKTYREYFKNTTGHKVLKIQSFSIDING